MYLLKIKKISLFCMISLLASSNASYVSKTKESAKELVKKIETLCDQAKKNKKTVALVTAACSLAALEVYGLLKTSGTDTSYARRFGHGILFGAGHLLNKLSPSFGDNLFSFEKNMLVGEEFVISKLQAILAMLVSAFAPANPGALDIVDLNLNANNPETPGTNTNNQLQVQEVQEGSNNPAVQEETQPNTDNQPAPQEPASNDQGVSIQEDNGSDNSQPVVAPIVSEIANTTEDSNNAPTNLQQLLESNKSSRSEDSDTESVSSRSSAVSITIDRPDHQERKDYSSDSNLSPKTSQDTDSDSDSADSEKIYAQQFKDPVAYADDLKTRMSRLSGKLFGDDADEKIDAVVTINIPEQDSQIINTQPEVIEPQSTIAQEANIQQPSILNKLSNYIVGDFNLGNFSL